MVVFEDAPAGVEAGKAAGFTVIALHTTHTLKQLKEAGADFIVQDMRSVSLWCDQGRAYIEHSSHPFQHQRSIGRASSNSCS
jgi:beta-phosphoglucomutase-like phosphatase (HAD superfamily)